MSNGSGSDRSSPETQTAERREASWIGKTLFVRGDVVSSGDLIIDGTFEGTIEVGDHALTIGPGAEVKADLVAKVITIHGAVVGNVTARERLDLKANASVDGNVRAPRFLMADGAVLRGSAESGSRSGTQRANT
jgi:cytoskeletal protein CcmA (bactofilin family)